MKTITDRSHGLLDEGSPDKAQFIRTRVKANMGFHCGNKRIRKKKAKQSLGLLYDILYGEADLVFDVVP